MSIVHSRRKFIKTAGIVGAVSLSGCQKKDTTKELVVRNESSDTVSMLVSVRKLSKSAETHADTQPPEDDADAIWEFEWTVDDLSPGETRKKMSLFAEEGTYWASAELEGTSSGAWVTGGTRSGTEVYATIQENGHLSVSNAKDD